MSDAPPTEPPPGTCDWGNCDYLAKFWRLSPGTDQWLPVCFSHSTQGEEFFKGLNDSYRNVKGSFA